MSDRPALNEDERKARHEVVTLVGRMLNGELSFLEGTFEVRRLRYKVGGILEEDPDFNTFTAVESETDHLPLAKQRPLWADEALERLAPEFQRAEDWASEFATEACHNPISRFSQRD